MAPPEAGGPEDDAADGGNLFHDAAASAALRALALALVA